MDEDRIKCPECLGEGFFMENKISTPCKKCKGNGYIYGLTKKTKTNNSKSHRWKP